jgi:mRNA interferase YafQ
MKIITRSNQFKRDYKRSVRTHKNTDKLEKVITHLARGEILPIKYQDHKLAGEYKDARECHVEPD